MEEHGRIAFGEPGFKRHDPCEAAGLRDEKGDEDDVFHIGGGKLLINPSGDLSVDHLVAGDLSAVALDDFVSDVGVLTVYSTDCFSVFFLFFESADKCTVI